MPRKRKKNARQRTQTGPWSRNEKAVTFKVGTLVLVFLLGLGFGTVAGYQAALVIEGDSAGVTDAYGRSPGHPHYRHNHP